MPPANAKEKNKEKVEEMEKVEKAEENKAFVTFTDSRDSTEYRIAKIGNQVWMAENLKFNASGSVCYDNEPANCDKYGRLYDWKAASKACPSGWHLPSDAEWQTLADFVGGKKIAGKKLKAKSFGGTDDYGFSALPGGERHFRGSFRGIGDCGVTNCGHWWSATEQDDYADWSSYWEMISKEPKVGWIFYNDEIGWVGCGKDFSFSVRCLQDGSESKKPSEEWVQKIAIYNGRVTLKMEKDDYVITMHFGDKNLNSGNGGNLRVRKVKNGYVIGIGRSDKIYSTLEEGLESFLKDYLEELSGRFYKNNLDKDAYWSAFVKEGKVKLFIEIIKGFIDDEFLNAPWV